MKNFLFILCLLLTGCNPVCLLSQISPQIIFVDQNCSAQIPDFTTLITAVDNCKLWFFYQDPAPGWLLPVDSTIIVKLRAGDVSGNINEIGISVTAKDLIKPQFIISPSLLGAAWKAVDKMYDMADIALVQLINYDTMLPYDSAFLPRAVGGSYFSGLGKTIYPVLNSSVSMGVTTYNRDGVLEIDSTYFKKSLIITVPPGHARTGGGRRQYSFK